jgi:hypothetical protein
VKKPTNQKLKSTGAQRQQKPNFQAMMNRLREHYLAVGVTEQEFAEIQRGIGSPARSAVTIALVMARLEEDGRRKPGGAGA